MSDGSLSILGSLSSGWFCGSFRSLSGVIAFIRGCCGTYIRSSTEKGFAFQQAAASSFLPNSAPWSPSNFSAYFNLLAFWRVQTCCHPCRICDYLFSTCSSFVQMRIMPKLILKDVNYKLLAREEKANRLFSHTQLSWMAKTTKQS